MESEDRDGAKSRSIVLNASSKVAGIARDSSAKKEPGDITGRNTWTVSTLSVPHLGVKGMDMVRKFGSLDNNSIQKDERKYVEHLKISSSGSKEGNFTSCV